MLWGNTEENQSHDKNKLHLYIVAGCCLFVIILTIIIVVVVGSCDEGSSVTFDRDNGMITENFRRLTLTPRPDYMSKVEKLGLVYHDEPSLSWSDCEEEPYWNDKRAV